MRDEYFTFYIDQEHAKREKRTIGYKKRKIQDEKNEEAVLKKRRKGTKKMEKRDQEIDEVGSRNSGSRM